MFTQIRNFVMRTVTGVGKSVRFMSKSSKNKAIQARAEAFDARKKHNRGLKKQEEIDFTEALEAGKKRMKEEKKKKKEEKKKQKEEKKWMKAQKKGKVDTPAATEVDTPAATEVDTPAATEVNTETPEK